MWTAYLNELRVDVQGRLIPVYPPTAMALFPEFSRLPLPLYRHPTAGNFWKFCTQFSAKLCVFSVNFGSWQSEIMTPKKYKNTNGVGKAYCMLAFLSGG